jgi:hypothetical protein
MLTTKRIRRSALVAGLIATCAAFAAPGEAAPPSSAPNPFASVHLPPLTPAYLTPRPQPQAVSPYAFLGVGIQPMRRVNTNIGASNVQQPPIAYTTNSITGANKFLSGPLPANPYNHCVPNVGIVGPDGRC